MENNDLEDLVFRMELTYSEIEKILHTKFIPTSSSGFTPLPAEVYENSDNIWF